MPPFAGKVAIVTGGASGIGRALGDKLAGQGARVVLADVAPERVAAAAEELAARGGQVRATALDVTDAEAVRTLVEETAAAEGGLDLLFNNAGVAVIGEARDLTLAHWERVLDVNVRGVVHGVTAAYPLMVAQGRGHIVNTASLAGLIPAPLLVPYATSKHAVVGLSTSLRAEARRLGVRVSCVCPGFVSTAMPRGAEYVGLDGAAATSEAFRRTPPVSPASCARQILRGVRRDQAIILVTGHARVASLLYRVSPGLGELVMRLGLDSARRHRRAGP